MSLCDRKGETGTTLGVSKGTETIRGEKKIDEAGFVFRMFFDSRGPDFSDELDTIYFATLVQSIVLLASPLSKNPLALKPKG